MNQQISVFAIVRNPQQLSDLAHYPNLTIIVCDMTNYTSLPKLISEREFDVCFHLAWEGTMGKKIQHLDTQLQNIKYSSDLMSILHSIDIKRLIFVDTISQYKYVPITTADKQTITKNFDVYGIAKQFTYKVLIQQASENNIHLNSVIMTNVFGIGDYSKRSTNIIIDKFLKNKSPSLANGNILYDWTYIDDVVQAMVIVAQKGLNLKQYYVGHRTLKTLEEIITTVRDIVNPNISLTFGTYHDTSFIDYNAFFNDELYQDTSFEITSDFKENIQKTSEWVKTIDF